MHCAATVYQLSLSATLKARSIVGCCIQLGGSIELSKNLSRDTSSVFTGALSGGSNE